MTASGSIGTERVARWRSGGGGCAGAGSAAGILGDTGGAGPGVAAGPGGAAGAGDAECPACATCGTDPVTAGAGADAGVVVAGAAVDCRGVTHCLVAGSSASSREAQYSCDGCMMLMRPVSDAPGRAHAASISAAKIRTCFNSAPSKRNAAPTTIPRTNETRDTARLRCESYLDTPRAHSKFVYGSRSRSACRQPNWSRWR